MGGITHPRRARLLSVKFRKTRAVTIKRRMESRLLQMWFDGRLQRLKVGMDTASVLRLLLEYRRPRSAMTRTRRKSSTWL